MYLRPPCPIVCWMMPSSMKLTDDSPRFWMPLGTICFLFASTRKSAVSRTARMSIRTILLKKKFSLMLGHLTSSSMVGKSTLRLLVGERRAGGRLQAGKGKRGGDVLHLPEQQPQVRRHD